MTSASELFYTRRSRSGRSDPDPGFASSLDRSPYHPNLSRRQHHARHDIDGCAASLRRSSLSSHQSRRLSAHSERSSIRLNQGSSQVPLASGGDGEGLRSSSRPVLSPSERLPGAVLLARARLLERLRGVSVPGNRQSSDRTTADADRREHVFGDEFRLVDAMDWGTDNSAEMSRWNLPFADFMFQRERRERVRLPRERNRKPPGLERAALDSLKIEVFYETRINTVDAEHANASQDCSICLERFVEGDELIRLSCSHRFHSACLVPWVRTCADCPYCRQGI